MGHKGGFNRILNQFLAAIMILIYHIFVGAFISRDSVAFIISMYIFVLTMIWVIGLPTEANGQLKDDNVDLNKFHPSRFR